MNTRNTVILAIVTILLLSLAVSAFAGGPKYNWTITAAGQSKDGGCTIIVRDQNGDESTIDGDASDLKGILAYFGVQKPKELEGRKLSGDDLGREVNTAAQWASRMSPEDKLVEVLAKGILSLKDFDLPKGMILCDFYDFVEKRYLRKDLLQKLGERIEVLSNDRFELGGAKPSEFIILPKSMCFDTLSVIETKMIVQGTGSDQTSRSTKIHRFTISALCRNAVQFDAEELTEQEMKEVHAP